MVLVSIRTLTGSLLIACLLVLYYLVPKGSSPYLIWFCLSIFYFYFYRSLKQPVSIIPGIKSYFKADLFFMMFYYIIYYLPYQASVLGLADLSVNNYVDLLFLEYTNISIVASTLGLIAFQMGYSAQIVAPARPKVRIELSFYRFLPMIVSLLFFGVFTLYIFTGARAMFSGAYATSDVGSVTENGVFFLVNHFAMFVFALTVLFYKFGTIPKVLKVAALLVMLWLLALLIIGDRSTFFLIALVLAAGFASYVKKISIKQISALIISAIFLYGVIEISRTSEIRGLDAIVLAATEGGKFEGINESSFSITTITSRAAFAIVPEKHEYFLGKFKLIGIAGIVPYSRGLFVSSSDPYISSSKVLKSELIGPMATWGVGTNIVSDIYMDFGVFGIIVVMFLIGYFANYIKSKVEINNHSIMWGVLYVYSIAFYAELPRYALTFPVRNFVWLFLMFYLYTALFKVKDKRQKTKDKRQKIKGVNSDVF